MDQLTSLFHNNLKLFAFSNDSRIRIDATKQEMGKWKERINKEENEEENTAIGRNLKQLCFDIKLGGRSNADSTSGLINVLDKFNVRKNIEQYTVKTNPQYYLFVVKQYNVLKDYYLTIQTASMIAPNIYY